MPILRAICSRKHTHMDKSSMAARYTLEIRFLLLMCAGFALIYLIGG